MSCPTRNPRCLEQGFCNCGFYEDSAQTAGGCGGVLFLMFIGVFVAFLYPAIRIFRSNIEYEVNGLPKFTGAVWLFTSPVFGFLASTLYQIVFALGACAVQALEYKFTNTVYIAGFFSIYALATGLAGITFLIKNRMAIKLFASKPETRNIDKGLILAGWILMMLITLCACAGVAFTAADAYFTINSNIQNNGKKESESVSGEINKFDSYIGKYRFVTRSDTELFLISKSENGKNLVLNMDDRKTNTTGRDGCLLTPGVEGNSVCYSISNCMVNGKKSPLAKVYFKIENNKTKMSFIYNTGLSGDVLEKIR